MSYVGTVAAAVAAATAVVHHFWRRSKTRSLVGFGIVCRFAEILLKQREKKNKKQAPECFGTQYA